MQPDLFETILVEERTRLVRLCAWFSGTPQAAEDLAQETLIAAWKNREQLASLEQLKPWTSAIARNVCLNWSRGQYREESRMAYSLDADAEPCNELADEADLELDLDRQELARLLDRALALLPGETSQMLVEHYIQESSHAEIAEKMRVNPGTVAVRLQRGKLTVRKLLQRHLQAEASAFDLIEQNQMEWEETNIWCPSCGAARLLGKYRKDEVFALRCPTCDPDTEHIMAGLDLTKPYHARLLGNVKTYKPAYARLLSELMPIYRQALRSGSAPCLACGSPLEVRVANHKQTHHHSEAMPQINLHCPACGWASNKSAVGLVIGSREAQRFWREYPRMRTLPAHEIDVNGSKALLTRLQSVTNSAELTVISRRDTFELIQVHTNVKL